MIQEPNKYIKLVKSSQLDELQRRINEEYKSYRLKEVKVYLQDDSVRFVGVLEHENVNKLR